MEELNSQVASQIGIKGVKIRKWVKEN